MQVDPTLMNVGDGGTVSREISAPNKASSTMVGNPSQTLPPEFRGDVSLSQQNKTTPTTDCKTAKACLDTNSYNHSPELSSPHQPNNVPMSGSALTSSDKRADKREEATKLKDDGVGVFPTPQWSSGVKVNREDSLNPCHSNLTSSKKSHLQTQSVQSVPPGFQCSAMYKPAQPVAFLPPTNFSSPLCKITLPPALGQIAALREATANQFQKEIQPQSSGLMRTFPYQFSMGRTPAGEKKAGTSTSKLKSNHSLSKNAKTIGEHKSLASVVASPAIALPLQHPSLTSAAPTHYTISPTAAICCGSALSSITSQSRLLNHMDKGSNVDKAAIGSLKTSLPSASEDQTACLIEPRDVPLDLSAKSKRPKCMTDPPVALIDPLNAESNQREFLNSKRTHATYSSVVQYPVLPNTHRNGSHQKQVQNHQIPESKPTWGKGSSQDSLKNIPGTYVGVASPILASTLRGKDGKGTFADEFQSFAKQEFISIIDQGEHLASGGKKPSCLMKGNQHAHSVKHVKNTSTTITKNCPSKGALSAALSSSAKTQIHQKSGPGKTAVPFSTTVVSPAWQQQSHLPHQVSSVQRKVTHGSPKNKGTSVPEGSKFQGTHHSPSHPEDDKWERLKSPLSNLTSVAKQQALETTALTTEGNNQSPPVVSRKADVLNTGSHETQSKHSAFEYTPYWSVDKWRGVVSQGDFTSKRHEKTNTTEPLENNTELHTSQGEHLGLQTKQGSSKPASQSHLFGSNASINEKRMESKLAQVLEGEILKKESGALDSSPSEKLEGMVASILKGQCGAGGDKVEKKTNGTKEESPAKAKAAPIKQKKTSPKKPEKEKSPTDLTKKASGKKKQDAENTPTKVSCIKKQKKKCAPVPEQNLPARKLNPQSKELALKDKISPNKVEQSTQKQPVTESSSSPASVEIPGSLNNSVISSNDTESSFPRLRRGRRRVDEARLDLWGFATPSPPPPPMPPPPPPPPPLPPSTSPPLIPKPPTRRPRGRPRSNPLPEQEQQGKSKSKASGADGDTPAHKKRRRCRSKKYQTGDYVTGKDKLEDGVHLEESDSLRQDSGSPTGPQTDPCPSPVTSSPEPPPLRPSLTRSGSVRYQESEASPECNDKPSGKRKFKSKHLCDSDEQKTKTKRSSLGKRGASLALDDGTDVKRTDSPPPAPKSLPSSPSKRGSSGRSSGSESPPKRPVPPEVRRLIVNKNAGETLLQRAARLGYQDVVQYCLEKDIREVNRRDNAGYTALHEASSRGWTQIVQILLKHGADVNCSAQDGTRPLHDAVASDNLPIVWLLLNHGADPTLATYSGHTPIKLAQSLSMKTFLTEYFTDLEGRNEQDSSLPWDFYSSSLFETDQEPCWDFLLSEQNQELEENPTGKTEHDSDKDCLMFEFSSEPFLPCFHVQVSLTQGFCNWFLLTDVLKRLKMSARIFRARYPHLEVVSLSRSELWRQVSVSQVSSALAPPYKGKNKEEEDEEGEEEDEEEEEGLVDLVRCVPELQRLLGSSIHVLQDNDEDEQREVEEQKTLRKTGKPRGR